MSLEEQLKNRIGKMNVAAASEEKSNGAPAPAPLSSNGSQSGLMQELMANFNKRKMTQAKADAVDNKSNTSNGSSDSGCGIILPSSTKGKTNGNTESPKTHRKAPSASSISSQEEVASKAINGLSHGPVTAETLERFRADLMAEVRTEINRAKQEIIEAIRSELRR